MAYGTLFMMAGAFTLATSGHVRGDVLYGFLSPRAQATIDLALYVVFFIPGVVALVWAGYEFAGESWAIREHSSVMADGPPIYPFKTVIPVAGAVLLVQGFAEIARCVLCLRDGAWPPRADEIKEVDVDELAGELRRDESISADDAIAMQREAKR
jgi:TRAP-type mannitol/chloroaromatic compound transport system permease small subunit